MSLFSLEEEGRDKGEEKIESDEGEKKGCNSKLRSFC